MVEVPMVEVPMVEVPQYCITISLQVASPTIRCVHESLTRLELYSAPFCSASCLRRALPSREKPVELMTQPDNGGQQ